MITTRRVGVAAPGAGAGCGMTLAVVRRARILAVGAIGLVVAAARGAAVQFPALEPPLAIATYDSHSEGD
jgi:hypothetical protein